MPDTTEAVIAASEIELDGGDTMLHELNIGEPIEIEKPTAGMRPGTWMVVAFENDDRTRARLRRLSREEIQAARDREALARIYE